MSMKMGDLAKRKEPDAPAKNTTPLRQPVRPQGRPTRGKEKIKSRTSHWRTNTSNCWR